MRLSSISPPSCKGTISQIAHDFPVPQGWKSQMSHDLEVFTVLYEDTSRKTKGHRKLNGQNQKVKKIEAIVRVDVVIRGCTRIVCILEWAELCWDPR